MYDERTPAVTNQQDFQNPPAFVRGAAANLLGE